MTNTGTPLLTQSSASPQSITPSPLPPSPQQQIEENEAPLLSLQPGQSAIAPHKPLVEMTDEELQMWHSRLRDYKNHMTFSAAVFPIEAKKETAAKKQPKDMSEFV